MAVGSSNGDIQILSIITFEVIETLQNVFEIEKPLSIEKIVLVPNGFILYNSDS